MTISLTKGYNHTVDKSTYRVSFYVNRLCHRMNAAKLVGRLSGNFLFFSKRNHPSK